MKIDQNKSGEHGEKGVKEEYKRSFALRCISQDKIRNMKVLDFLFWFCYNEKATNSNLAEIQSHEQVNCVLRIGL